MTRLALRDLAVPSVCLLICFLAYSSQYVFYYLEPGPLTTKEAAWFNGLVLAIWLSYERAVRVDPGRLPKKLVEAGNEDERDAATRDEQQRGGGEAALGLGAKTGRWCKKCAAVKPPRSHHCRQCGRCIPKMDHHCPWTANCVSHTTFPHFLRFVLYVTISLLVLAYHLFVRLYALYETRNQPSYLGPSVWALAHLMILTLTTTMVFFALTILLVTATYSLVINTTMIETWEIERHDALVEKSRYLGGFLYGPGGRRVRITKQEFPYDIGIWRNLVQGMGTSNVIAWMLPVGGGGPSNDSGWAFETNGFEDADVTWPPVDPDKLPRGPAPQQRRDGEGNAFVHRLGGGAEGLDEVQAFRRRQEADYRRWEGMRSGDARAGIPRSSEYRSRPTAAAARQGYVEEGEVEDDDQEGEGKGESDSDDYAYEEGLDGEEGWTSRDGSRLRDFGVDEDAEMHVGGGGVAESMDDPFVDDDVPLAELIRRRKAAMAAETASQGQSRGR